MTELASMIDHTLLSPQSTEAEITQLCSEAKEYGFKSVCVAPHFVSLAKSLLLESEVLVCTVIGFPLGYSTTSTKVHETSEAISNGADEIDMVINNALLKDSLMDQVTADIAAVVKAAEGKTVKVILETCLLEPYAIALACECATKAKAHFVKTSTGFSKSGATIEAVKLMKENIAPTMQIKASGGIRSLEVAQLMIEAGATRLGTSSSLVLIGKSNKEKNY